MKSIPYMFLRDSQVHGRFAHKNFHAFVIVATVAVAAVDATAALPGLPEGKAAKAVVRCQLAIAKDGAKLFEARLRSRATCANAIFECVQSHPDDVKCVAKARARCAKQALAIEKSETTFEQRLAKKCGDKLAFADLLRAEGLGYAQVSEQCPDLFGFAVDDVSSLVRCIGRQHMRLADRLYGAEQPRTHELFRHAGVPIPVEFPDHGGTGEGVGNKRLGKAIETCTTTIAAAGKRLTQGLLGNVSKCVAKILSCVQTKNGDARCLDGARSACSRAASGEFERARAAFTSMIEKRCSEASGVTFETLRAATAANLDALGCTCFERGVDTFDGMIDVTECVLQQHQCFAATLMRFTIPRIEELLAEAGVDLLGELCLPVTPPVPTDPAESRAARATQGIRRFVTTVRGTIPIPQTARYFAGRAPKSTRSAPKTVTVVEGQRIVTPGSSSPLRIRYTRGSAPRATAAAPNLLIAVQRGDGTFVDDFFEVDLDPNESEAQLDVEYAENLAACVLQLAFATRDDDIVSDYVTFEQVPLCRPDGEVGPGEDCDPSGDDTPCPQRCLSNCQCFGDFCGNARVDGNEQCEGTTIPRDCASFGLGAGTTVCRSSCLIDTSGCDGPSGACGDGVVNPGEQCDESLLRNSNEFRDRCREDCTLPRCGDSVVDTGEQCDTFNLNGQSCVSRGFAFGKLFCSSSCTFDDRGCSAFATPTATPTSSPGSTPTGSVPTATSTPTPSTIRASVRSDGGESIDTSEGSAISADGRFIAFRSLAPNLVPGDTNAHGDTFVYDRQTKVTTRVSVDSAGTQGNGGSGSGGQAFSADGRFVAFQSDASNLVPGDANGSRDIFMHDRQTGATTRVSVDSAGTQGDAASFNSPAVSADGRFVAFSSFATNLVPGDTNGRADVFVRDRQLGLTTRVSVDSSGTQGDDNSFADPAISADARFVAFRSDATNLVPGDTNAVSDIFVRDLQLGITTRVSVASTGAQGNGQGRNPVALSADGRFVAFPSEATNLVPGVPGDTNDSADIFVRDRQLGITTRVSVNNKLQEGNGNSFDSVALSADGRFVAFLSDATNFIAGDINGTSDLFVHDQETSITTCVSVDSAGTPGNDRSHYLALSADARFVAFVSSASNLVPADANGRADVFVRDRGP